MVSRLSVLGIYVLKNEVKAIRQYKKKENLKVYKKYVKEGSLARDSEKNVKFGGILWKLF